MKQFKVVRTYMESDGRQKLQDAFDAGYELVRASEFVPDTKRGNTTYYGYIEYILAKEDPEETEKAETKAYFDGQAYGWEEGRKDLCDKISAEIEERIAVYDNWQSQRECTATEANTMREALAIIKKYKRESEEA